MESSHRTMIAESGLTRGDAGLRIEGFGEMAGLIREKDWSKTPLGPIHTWSDTLVSLVNVVLLSPFSFALYWGEELTLLYNDAYRPFLGEKHPAAMGGRGPEVWQEAWPVIGEPILLALREGRATNASQAYIPILIDGALQPRWWTYGFYPVYEHGQIAGVANPGADDTEQVKATRALAESEARVSQVLSATTDAVVMMDRSWTLTYLNPKAESMYGAAAELIGKNLWTMFPDAVYEGSPFVRHSTEAMEKGIAGRFEEHYPEPLNMTVAVEVYPTKDGIVAFSRDVTDLKRASAALMQNEKLAAVGRLASSIAHEINNPLEAMTNLLYLAKTSTEMGEIREYLETAERELRRMSVITSQTLRFHKQSTRPSKVTCSMLFQESLSIYQGRLMNSRITVEKRKRAVRTTTCFEGEIRQVLSTLIGNAIDAMAQGGRLLVRSRDATNWKTGGTGLMLTVADTGTGMPAPVVKRIFEAFYTTKGIGGTGLGLWVSREIVDRHKGRLRVRSATAEGRSGTVFTLFLPMDEGTGPEPMALP